MLQTLRTLGQKYSVEILEAADEPRSVTWFSEELDVPIATCYRRVKQLVEIGFLDEEDSRRDDGRSMTQYRRSVDRVALDFSPGLSISSLPRVPRRATTVATETAGVVPPVTANAMRTRFAVRRRTADRGDFAAFNGINDENRDSNSP